MLYYLPLESIEERYTYQWSKPIDGWLEGRWNEAEIPFQRIDGVTETRPIEKGRILDCLTRTTHCFKQIEHLLDLAEHGMLTGDDVIYFDDFWHMGLEALPYMFDQIGLTGDNRPKMYCYLFAQSVDEYDFTHSMLPWIRYFERGIGSLVDGIFVACPTLKELVVKGNIAPEKKVHAIGFPINSKEIASRMNLNQKRELKVVYSSRFDKEKNPWFFLEVADTYLSMHSKSVKFVITTSAAQLRSNDPSAVRKLESMRQKWPDNIILKSGLSKEEYYNEICTAKIQFNCANQDFISFTLLEAAVAGAYPLYPHFRSFPETLRNHPQFMYEHLDVSSAVHKIHRIFQLGDFGWDEAAIADRRWIHLQYQHTWKRMLQIMGLMADSEEYKIYGD